MGMSTEEKRVYEFGPFRLDSIERLLLRDGAPVSVAPKVFHTLVALVERNGRLVEKEELLREIWPDSFVEEANLSMNVSAARRALGEGPGEHRYIETVSKRGYRFVASVRVLSNGSAHGDGNGAYADVVRVPEPAAVPEVAAIRAGCWRRRAAIAAGLVVLIAATVAVTLAISWRLDRRPAGLDFQKMHFERVAGTGKVVNAVISPDGKYLAQVASDGPRAGLSIRHVGTARTVELVPPADVTYEHVTFSPDGAFIYYVVYDSELVAAYRIPALGGAPARIAENVDRAIDVSPDGSRVAYVRVNGIFEESEVVVADADGSDARTVYVRRRPEPLLFGNAAWSPDGKRIVCVALVGAAPDLVSLLEIDVESGATRPLGVSRWKVVERVAWTPDGEGVALAALPEGAAGEPFQIWYVSYPDGMVRRITNDLNSYRDLSLTSDGSTIVSVQSNSRSRIDIVASKGDAAATRHLEPGSSTMDGMQGIAWAPDGRIVYLSWGSGNCDIWTTNVDGTGVVQVTCDAYRESGPEVTPDGRYIVYTSNRGGGMGIWRVEIGGGTPTRLTSGPKDARPMCSPDGWVYFTRRVEETSRFYKVRIDGGDPVELFDATIGWAALSPDGTMLAGIGIQHDDDAAAADDSPYVPICVVSTSDGREIERLRPELLIAWSSLRWSPDGRGLTYVATRDGVSNVWLLPVGGGAPRPLTDFETDYTANAAWSPDGTQLACTRVSSTSSVVMITGVR